MTVYILWSDKLGKYYIGQTADFSARLIRHNSGQVPSTKAGLPWKVITTFGVANRSKAILLEKKIKSRGAKRYLFDIGM